MESNETTHPLAEVPADKTPETETNTSSANAQPVKGNAEEEAAAVTLPTEENIQLEETTTSSEDELVNEKEKEALLKYEPKQTKEEVIERLKEIDANGGKAERQEIDYLKQTFYKLQKAETDAARKSFEEQGGTPEAFAMPEDDSENRFKTLLGDIKEKRNALAAKEEKELEENLLKKLHIIERLKTISESQEDSSKSYNEFKKLQQEWNSIRRIPANKVNELWRNYQLYAEKFYDLIKLNNEFREYDFKKNLEIKTHLCQAAERLADEPDVVSAFHQLQKLHQEFRETGPIAKDLREAIWTRFKAASTAVNRRHQQHFEELKEKEQTNLDAKIVICEIAEGMEYDKFKNFRDWSDKTQEILALQAKWKTIGYAPRKINVKIFERFRAACDEFFRRKAEFFRQMKEEMNANLEKKRALIEKAEALKDSTEWKKTTEALTELQKEWKTIGPVPKKHSDAIWKRFIDTCDRFFEKRNKATSSQYTEEQNNLKAKRNIIQQLNEIDARDELNEGDENNVRELMKTWNETGHVPFREKDRIYKQYHTVIDSLSNKMNISAKHFPSSLYAGSKGTGDKEHDRLVRLYENMKNEIQTYENNLGFFNTSSEKGSGLLDEMKRKVEKLKAEAEKIRQKISNLAEEPPKEEQL